MTDPFFTTWNNINPNNTPPQTPAPQVTPADQIKTLNDQQNQIQSKYKELKNLYSEQNGQKLTIEQKQQVGDQMQKLSDLYTQNKQTLAMLSTNIAWEKQVQINKDVVVKEQKKWKKVSFRWIMIGCIVLFIFLVGWLAAVFYYLIQNPNQLSSVGIDPQTATQLLQTFATIFFGLLFFASLWLLITNFYRLTTAKNKRKIWYVMGIIFGFIMLVWTLVWWAKILDMLKNIEIDDFIDANKLLKPYIQLKDNTAYLDSDPNLVAIAPVNMFYSLNSELFNKQIMPQLWAVTLQELSLDCGNGQTLDMDMQNATFNWACMYQNKWNYPLKLMVNYVDNQTAEQLTEDIPAWELPIRSQIEIRTNQWPVEFSKNEIIVWTNPIKVTYDASDIFTEFQLPEYKIIWDANGDWVADKSDLTTYTHLYTWAKLYSVNIRFPWLNDYLYTFPVRVEQSDVPVAQINYTAISETEYNISAEFFGTNPDISEYIFNIIDKKTNKQIDSITAQATSINYVFPGNGIYAVQMVFVTQEWKQWKAESEDIVIWGSEFQILYDVYIKTPTSPQFKKLEDIWDIQLKEIPTILKLEITKVIPTSPTIQQQVFIDGSPIVSTDNSFQTTIDSSKDYNLKIVITDPNRDAKTEKEIKVSVKRDDIIWNLLVSPDTVGTSPFEVKFDASTTTINDPQDEIVYFTRDFGDGEIKENLSQSIISHTYNYDFESENGTFYPSVIIKTKKGRELLIGSWTMVLVKKPNVTLSIHIDSHPAQVANIWEKIDMSLDIDGLPESIVRDFGNWNTLECGGRECTEASQIYNTPWEYMIEAKVTYTDKPTVEWKINLVVK